MSARLFKRSLSKQEVESNDNLLMEILVRLPPRTIFRFRCVEKRWRNIVANPLFLDSYRKRQKEGPGTLVAFIQKTIVISEAPSWKHYMNILPVAETNNYYKIDTSIESLGHFIGSSNGLILCGRHPDTYYVVNPLTRRIVSLPPPQVYKSRVMALVCEENARELVPSYKVVVADEIQGDGLLIPSYYQSKNGEVPNTLMIETYSSETGKWVTSALWVAENLTIEKRPPLVVDSLIHWFDSLGKWRLAIYDLNSNHVQLVELPAYEARQKCNTTRSSRDDPLWFAMNNSLEGCLKVWILPNNKMNQHVIPASEWNMIYSICYNSLSHDAIFCEKEHSKFSVPYNSVFESSRSEKCPFLFEALIPWKPKAGLFTRKEKFYICNIESEYIKMVEHIGYPTQTGSHIFDFGWYPYLAPLCLSSYALSDSSN